MAKNDPAAGQRPGPVNDPPPPEGDTFLNRKASRQKTPIMVARHHSQLDSHIAQATMKPGGDFEASTIFDQIACHDYSENLVSSTQMSKN
jgi:hypothetical protein